VKARDASGFPFEKTTPKSIYFSCASLPAQPLPSARDPFRTHAGSGGKFRDRVLSFMSQGNRKALDTGSARCGAARTENRAAIVQVRARRRLRVGRAREPKALSSSERAGPVTGLFNLSLRAREAGAAISPSTGSGLSDANGSPPPAKDKVRSKT